MLGAAAAAAAMADLDLRQQVREMAAQLQAQERAMEVLNQKARPPPPAPPLRPMHALLSGSAQRCGARAAGRA